MTFRNYTLQRPNCSSDHTKRCCTCRFRSRSERLLSLKRSNATIAGFNCQVATFMLLLYEARPPSFYIYRIEQLTNYQVRISRSPGQFPVHVRCVYDFFSSFSSFSSVAGRTCGLLCTKMADSSLIISMDHVKYRLHLRTLAALCKLDASFSALKS